MQFDEFVIDKEPVKATCSQHLKNILFYPVIGKNVFAHIRLATVGEINLPIATFLQKLMTITGHGC